MFSKRPNFSQIKVAEPMTWVAISRVTGALFKTCQAQFTGAQPQSWVVTSRVQIYLSVQHGSENSSLIIVG